MTVGPTMEFVRGQTAGVYLRNNMTVCGADYQIDMANPTSGWKPHGFTTTNLHTHGLHVSPQAPSDDVLIMLRSSADTNPAVTHLLTSYPYLYSVPGDHPVGTFWYHPHKHGAVASQVGAGMSGALIVRGTEGDGDIDDLLATQCNITAHDEVVAVLQTIDYFYTNTERTEAVFYPAGYYIGGGPDPSTCLGKTLTAQDTTLTSINGQFNPTIAMELDQIIRLRLVNASNGQTYVPKLKFTGDGPAPTLPAVYAIAVDGITLLPPDDIGDPNAPYFKIDYNLSPTTDINAYYTTGEILTLAPGQRLDLLIQAAAPGTFQLYGAALGVDDPAPSVVQHGEANTNNLLQIAVSNSSSNKNQPLPKQSLFKTSTIKRPEIPQQLLATSQSTTATVPSTMPVATQTLEFKTLNHAFNNSGVPTQPAFLINGRSFDGHLGDPAQVQLFKGDSDVWNLYSSNDAHIFHIHVNSFATFARVPYDTERSNYGAAVYYQMPIWRDTVYFDAGDGDNFVPGTMVVMASKQVNFTGEFVLHCHNLFHEDNGMMLTVAVLDPETGAYDAPVSAQAGHGH